jgi:hypothetical protein
MMNGWLDGVPEGTGAGKLEGEQDGASEGALERGGQERRIGWNAGGTIDRSEDTAVDEKMAMPFSMEC